MRFFRALNDLRHSPKRFIITLVLAVLVIILGLYSYSVGGTRQKLKYNESLDSVAVVVDGEQLTLTDTAFYVAYEEQQVEQQALVYNPEKTNKYWNLHIDGEFVKIAARNAAIQMAIHDEIFYRMALDEGIELTDEEIQYARNSLEDFLYDMEDLNQQDKINVDRDVYEATIMKVALAVKEQEIYAASKGEKTEHYDFSEDAYRELLKKHDYEINKGVWNRVDFGNVTLDH